MTLALLVATFVTPVSLVRGVHATVAYRPAANLAVPRGISLRPGAAISVTPTVDPGELQDERELPDHDDVEVPAARVAPLRTVRCLAPPLPNADSQILRI
jgi:hypothetical protein